VTPKMGSRAAGCTSFHQEPEDATAAAEDDDDDDMKRLLLLANAAIDPAIMSDSSRNTNKDTESSEDVPLHQMRKKTLENAYTVLQQQDKNKPENKTHAPESSVSWFSRDGATAAMGPSVVARRQNRSERRRPREKQQRELPDWWMDG